MWYCVRMFQYSIPCLGLAWPVYNSRITGFRWGGASSSSIASRKTDTPSCWSIISAAKKEMKNAGKNVGRNALPTGKESVIIAGHTVPRLRLGSVAPLSRPIRGPPVRFRVSSYRWVSPGSVIENPSQKGDKIKWAFLLFHAKLDMEKEQTLYVAR